MKAILLIFSIFLINFAQCAEFGQYRYSHYLGLQQQLQNQRMRAIKNQRMRYQNPTRNIRYPSMGNPYPNIQRHSYQPISARQRYSAQYYRNL